MRRPLHRPSRVDPICAHRQTLASTLLPRSTALELCLASAATRIALCALSVSVISVHKNETAPQVQMARSRSAARTCSWTGAAQERHASGDHPRNRRPWPTPFSQRSPLPHPRHMPPSSPSLTLTPPAAARCCPPLAVLTPRGLHVDLHAHVAPIFCAPLTIDSTPHSNTVDVVVRALLPPRASPQPQAFLFLLAIAPDSP